MELMASRSFAVNQPFFNGKIRAKQFDIGCRPYGAGIMYISLTPPAYAGAPRAYALRY